MEATVKADSSRPREGSPIEERIHKKARQTKNVDPQRSASFEEGPSGITLVGEESVGFVKRSNDIPYIDLSKIKARSRTPGDKLHITKVPREKRRPHRPQSLST